jgi:hypothetical protein
MPFRMTTRPVAHGATATVSGYVIRPPHGLQSPTTRSLTLDLPLAGSVGVGYVCRATLNRGTSPMTITRHEPSKIYSKVVEANGFVFTAGIVADDVSKDVHGQTVQILAEIDRLLKLAGTDKTKPGTPGPAAKTCPAAPASKPNWPTHACSSKSASPLRSKALQLPAGDKHALAELPQQRTNISVTF